MKKKLQKILGISVGLGLLSLFFLAGGCSFFEEKPHKNDNKVAFPVYKVDTGTVVLSTNFLGAVEGKVNVEIRPQVEGELERSYVDEGDYVEKGQKLFKINPQEYRQSLNQAIAHQNVEKANLNNAKTEVDRLRPLVENEVMAPVRLEKEKSNYQIARANLKQAKAEVAHARIKLGYTTIKAPVSGYIGRIPKRIGNLVKPGDDNPITVLSDVQEVYVYFSINESDYYNLKKSTSTKIDSSGDHKRKEINKEVSLILPDGSTYDKKGYIDATSGQVNKNTGTVTLRATFPNEENILRSGNTVTLVMYNKEEGKVLIPQKTTYELQAETFVDKLTPDNRVVRQSIDIKSDAPNNQYIINSGLQRGDRILVEGQNKVSDSAVIKPLPYVKDTLVAPGQKSKSPDTVTIKGNSNPPEDHQKP